MLVYGATPQKKPEMRQHFNPTMLATCSNVPNIVFYQSLVFPPVCIQFLANFEDPTTVFMMYTPPFCQVVIQVSIILGKISTNQFEQTSKDSHASYLIH